MIAAKRIGPYRIRVWALEAAIGWHAGVAVVRAKGDCKTLVLCEDELADGFSFTSQHAALDYAMEKARKELTRIEGRDLFLAAIV